MIRVTPKNAKRNEVLWGIERYFYFLLSFILFRDSHYNDNGDHTNKIHFVSRYWTFINDLPQKFIFKPTRWLMKRAYIFSTMSVLTHTYVLYVRWASQNILLSLIFSHWLSNICTRFFISLLPIFVYFFSEFISMPEKSKVIPQKRRRKESDVGQGTFCKKFQAAKI